MIELWQAAVGAIVIGLLVYSYWTTANRLDRLHRKVEASRTALDHQLIARAIAVGDLALSGIVDPASSLVLSQAAFDVREASEHDELEDIVAGHHGGFSEERLSAESNVSRVLREALNDITDDSLDGDPTLGALASACYRAELARRFHNEAVAQARAVRQRRIVRWLRMAGSAPWPQTADYDDSPPELLVGRRG